MSKRSAKCLMLNFSPRVGYSNDAPDRMCEEQNDFHWQGGSVGTTMSPPHLSPCQWKFHIRFGASLENSLCDVRLKMSKFDQFVQNIV